MTDGDGWTILGRDEFERMEGSGECIWGLARKSLGVHAFGMNMVEIGPGGQIPEHDESQRDHEEGFIVWEGNGTAAIAGGGAGGPARGPSGGPRDGRRRRGRATS